jgi:hypothetical protein
VELSNMAKLTAIPPNGDPAVEGYLWVIAA